MLETIFSVDVVAFNILGYPLSWVELIGTVFGLWCVWLTVKGKVSSWPIGIINIIFFFILFYQVHLYSDMLLQVFFLVLSIYGWYRWTHPKTDAEKKGEHELKISLMDTKSRIIATIVIVFLTLDLFEFMSRIHIILPSLFPAAALAPLRDAFTAIISIAAQYLLAKKKLEAWILWILVDIVSIGFYFQANIVFVAIEYIIFLCLASKGLYDWYKEYDGYGKIRG